MGIVSGIPFLAILRIFQSIVQSANAALLPLSLIHISGWNESDGLISPSHSGCSHGILLLKLPIVH